MRINVYSQELTKEVGMVEKSGFHGVRMYFSSPDCLHNTPDDDDRSAITFWIPQANSFTPEDLAIVFDNMATLIRSKYL